MTAAFWKQRFFFSDRSDTSIVRRTLLHRAGNEVVLKITCNSCFNTCPRLRKEFTRTDSAHSGKLTGSDSQNGARLEHTLQKLWHNNNTITKLPPNNALMVSRWHVRSLSRLTLSFFCLHEPPQRSSLCIFLFKHPPSIWLSNLQYI